MKFQKEYVWEIKLLISQEYDPTNYLSIIRFSPSAIHSSDLRTHLFLPNSANRTNYFLNAL